MAVITAVALGAVACTESSGGAEGAASCAFVIDYDNRRYIDVANVDFTVGAKLGTATHPPCDDTGGDDDEGSKARPTTAYEVEGLDPAVAIAVGTAPDDAVFVAVRSGKELPPEIEELIAR
ncbi:DUF6281 family protein [Streptomyces sp. NPDC050803]|uniref:DUF6281 family protein n=1 Tax=unclassified Streptomyces TaxID=2593676 RepID=UPI0034384F52